MLEHVNKVRESAVQLEAIEALVSDDDQVTTPQGSLPDTYDNLIVALESRADDLRAAFARGRPKGGITWGRGK